MTRILLLIPTASYRATDFMKAASRVGLEIVVGSDEGQILADLFPGRSITASFARPAEGAQEIAKFADSYPLDSIVAVDDTGTVLAARAADLLRLPHNAVGGVEATRNKALLRQRLSERGLPSPEFHVCSLDDDVAAIARSVRYPCVIKPLSLSGSRGVIRADDAVSFAEAVGRLRGILERPEVAEECGPTAREYLVEGYIPGDEVALEGLLTGGALHVLALFDKPDPLVGPFFEETIYVTPSGLPQARQREIARTAAQAASALGIVDGPIHAEFRLNSEGCWPIDIAARSIGGLCSRT
ncbi:MAG: ATP-grasp domain-containing protein, partial [Dehalococcoidia bacterium]